MKNSLEQKNLSINTHQETSPVAGAEEADHRLRTTHQAGENPVVCFHHAVGEVDERTAVGEHVGES